MTTPNAGLEGLVGLLPCPWCGDEMEGPPTVSEGSTFRWRKVDGCCTDGPEVRHNTLADDQAAAEIESTAKAIAAWNTRATYQSLPGAEGDARDVSDSMVTAALNAWYGTEPGPHIEAWQIVHMHAAIAAALASRPAVEGES